MDKFTDAVRNRSKEHGSIVFWSWNSKLDACDLKRQIKDMHNIGMRGFFMHARPGLITGYMSDEWFDAVRLCIDEAEKYGMEAWAYDENGWPSGFAGGMLLNDPSNYAKGVSYEKSDVFPAGDSDLLGVYVMRNGAPEKVSAPEDGATYHVFRRTTDRSYVDLMDRKVTDRFIASTYEEYKKRLGQKYWSRLRGFFTDEPQYFRWGTAWSDTFFTTFEKRFGYSVYDAIPALFLDFDGSNEKRYDYYLLCHEQFYGNYLKPLYDWCDSNGTLLTGHGVEEWGLEWQMTCCGGIMPFYRYEHIPGIDYLGRPVKNAMGCRQIDSVCAQLGKKTVLTESFAGCGWDVTPRELKRIADMQFANGVNLICEHLYPMSEAGQRKRDYPLHYSEHSTWHMEFEQFEKHYAHLGAALSEGTEDANVLVLHPIRSAYLFFGKDGYEAGCPESAAEMKRLDREFDILVEKLSADGIAYHFADESLLREFGEVRGNRITIGKCEYDTLLIPYCHTIDGTTAEMIKKYAENGGKICLAGRAPDRMDGRKSEMPFIRNSVTYDEVKESSPVGITASAGREFLHSMSRTAGGCRVVFVANTGAETLENVNIRIKKCGKVCELVPETLEKRAVCGYTENGDVFVTHSFGPSESLLLIEDENAEMTVTTQKPGKIIDLSKLNFTFENNPENSYIIDYARVGRDGGPLSEKMPVSRIRDELIREKFRGQITLEYEFITDFVPEDLLFVAEPQQCGRVTVNGMAVLLCEEYARIDRHFVGCPIEKYVKPGVNVIRMTFPYSQPDRVFNVLYGTDNEATRNSLTFGTEIEDIYLFGSFITSNSDGFAPVDEYMYQATENFTLKRRKREINIKDITSDGYAFFSGEMRVTADYVYNTGMPSVLKADGRYAVVDISVNGKRIPRDIFAESFDLSEYLHEGKNRLDLRVVFSPRNLMGPHHRGSTEDFSSPRDFSFEKKWINGACPSYVPGYMLVKAGL